MKLFAILAILFMTPSAFSAQPNHWGIAAGVGALGHPQGWVMPSGEVSWSYYTPVGFRSKLGYTRLLGTPSYGSGWDVHALNLSALLCFNTGPTFMMVTSPSNFWAALLMALLWSSWGVGPSLSLDVGQVGGAAAPVLNPGLHLDWRMKIPVHGGDALPPFVALSLNWSYGGGGLLNPLVYTAVFGWDF